MGDVVEVPGNVYIHYPVHSPEVHRLVSSLDNLFGTSLRSEPERTVFEVRLEYGFKNDFRRHLYQSVLDNGNAQRAGFTVSFRDVLSPNWLGAIRIFY